MKLVTDCCLRLTGIGFAMIISQASAQITDPDQRMRWFNLQRVAIVAREIDICRFLDAEPKQRYEAAYDSAASEAATSIEAYDSAASEAATSIEAYIKQYPNRRFKDESPDAYRYRVWSVAMSVGMEKARSSKQLNQSECDLLTLTR